MEENLERKVKGIWIPIEIWEDKKLNWNEKILFLEIDSYTTKDKDCYISNEYISKLLHINETSANKILSSLIQKGYVIKTAFDGRHRFVKSALSISTSQPCDKAQSSVVNNDNIPNIYNNIYTNKEDKDKSLSKKENESNKNDEWKRDYEAYRKIVEVANKELKADVEFKNKQERYFPNIDYELTIDKGCDYWLSENGYKKCKQAKGKMNMLSRLKNNFDKNKIYHPYNSKKVDSPINTPIDNDVLIINNQIYK